MKRCRLVYRSLKKRNGKTSKRQDTGQIVVEYVLLMIVAVALSALVMRSCVSRQEDQAGMIIQLWDTMVRTIGADTADEIKK
jgi:hypothetical protein